MTQAQLKEERRNITMIFQGFNLLMQRNCLKMFVFLWNLQAIKRRKRLNVQPNCLNWLVWGEKLKSYPAQLSGGQQQRVAIARALATHPKIFYYAMKQTSALDPQTTQSILSLIKDIHDKLGLTVIIITHQMSVVEQICTRVAILNHGTVVEEGAVSEVFASPKSQEAKQLVYRKDINKPLKQKEKNI